jgi:hypothetical protein
VAIVLNAMEYQDRFLELKKYSSAELPALIFPVRATTKISKK